MCLIEYKEIIANSDHEFSDSHSISGEHNFGLLIPFFFKPYVVSNLISNDIIHLLCYSLGEGDGADSSGLRDDDSVELRK